MFFSSCYTLYIRVLHISLFKIIFSTPKDTLLQAFCFSKKRPQWPSGRISALGPEGSRLETRRVWGLLQDKSYVVAKRPPAGVAWKFGERVPAQASSSSSDRGSKLRGPSQNSPCVAFKRDVNITKN
ncbi:hypothetical protein AVEN_63163-1 [Araneus ventricosus]|uniref:Uncharacterized protein n=1 Tax=Araneus ventricosus TaxID=182803 RepID=A0A4Y2B116_ARAVE|nr:hypothetical protein AVEN_63163-1 [Araneus ventricosus]